MRKELHLVEVYVGRSKTRKDFRLARTPDMATTVSSELFAKWMEKTHAGQVYTTIDGEFDQGWQPD